MLGILVSLMTAAAPPSFPVALHYGPHPVGFGVQTRTDAERTGSLPVDALGRKQSSAPRKVVVAFWYPAAPSAPASPIRLADQVALALTTDRPVETLANVHSDRTLEAVAAAAAGAVRGLPHSPPLQGRFPVLVYGASFNATALENVDLCEYFASHGYIVAAVGSNGVGGRAMTSDRAGLEEQVGDMALALDVARGLPGADLSQVAAMGFSWGGLAAFVLAARQPTVKAVVGLDASIRYYYKGFREAVPDAAKTLRVPFVDFAGRSQTLEQLARWKHDSSASFFEDLVHADRSLVSLHNLAADARR